MDDNEKLFNELNEIEDILKEQGLFDAFKPEWADCPDPSLEVGHDYVYYLTEEICMRGHVLYNDGVTAILKVVNRYEECFSHVINYNEIKQFYPAFNDPDTERLSEYFLVDVETEDLLLFKDPEDDVIKSWKEDDGGEWKLYEVDSVAFRLERIKKEFLHEFNQYSEERGKENAEHDTIISVDLDQSAIDDISFEQ